MTEYQPDFEPFLVRKDLENGIACKLGLQAINIVEGDTFNWYAKVGNSWKPLSVVFGILSRNKYHLFTAPEKAFNLVIKLSVNREGVVLEKERHLELVSYGNIDQFMAATWELKVNGVLYQRISTSLSNIKGTQSDLGIDKTPFIIEKRYPTTEFPFVESTAVGYLKTCGG